MKNKEIYADGIGQIHFAGSMVRYDFVSIEPTENEPTFQAIERVIMPPQGFLNMFNSMQELIDKLLEAGILTKNQPQELGTKIEDAVIIDEEPPAEKTKTEKPAKKTKTTKKTK